MSRSRERRKKAFRGAYKNAQAIATIFEEVWLKVVEEQLGYPFTVQTFLDGPKVLATFVGEHRKVHSVSELADEEQEIIPAGRVEVNFTEIDPNDPADIAVKIEKAMIEWINHMKEQLGQVEVI